MQLSSLYLDRACEYLFRLAGLFGTFGIPIEAATLVADALYQGVSSPGHCHHIILQTERLPPSLTGAKLKTHLHNAIVSLSEHGDVGLTALLTSIACLAHLCAAEMALPQNTALSSGGAGLWFAAATKNGSFAMAAHSIMTACEVCNALLRKNRALQCDTA